VDWASDDQGDDNGPRKSSGTGYDVTPTGYGNNVAEDASTSGYGTTNGQG